MIVLGQKLQTQGCFADSENRRLLEHDSRLVFPTRESCLAYCDEEGFTHASVQYQNVSTSSLRLNQAAGWKG